MVFQCKHSHFVFLLSTRITVVADLSQGHPYPAYLSAFHMHIVHPLTSSHRYRFLNDDSAFDFSNKTSNFMK